MTQAPLNGNYPAQHGYPDSFNPAHAAMNTAANFQPAQSSTPTTATPTEQQKNEISKDEVGWFFVEQYYTTMSRNPDKLHLFYSRRSQLVFGTEAESVPVAIGTKVSVGFLLKNMRLGKVLIVSRFIGYQRQDQASRLPGVQGSRPERRLAGLL